MIPLPASFSWHNSISSEALKGELRAQNGKYEDSQWGENIFRLRAITKITFQNDKRFLVKQTRCDRLNCILSFLSFDGNENYLTIHLNFKLIANCHRTPTKQMMYKKPLNVARLQVHLFRIRSMVNEKTFTRKM